MQRRTFILGAASTALTGIAVTGCGATATSSTTTGRETSAQQRRRNIDGNVTSGLSRLYSAVPGSREMVANASGVLVFPNVIAAGLGVGGQYGEGSLRVRNTTEGYFSLASASVGLQIGAQSKTVVFLFLTQDALDRFRNSRGWSVGVDASVAVLRAGANGSVDASTVTGPVVAFVLTNAGLMANLTLAGTKITQLEI